VAAFLAGVPNLTANPGAEAIFSSLWEQFAKGNNGKIFNTALEALGIAFEAETIGHLVRLYREHKPDIILPAESKQILDTLKPKYTLGLLTDGFLPTQPLTF